ncbi:MAG: peptide ABC transporter substrate-binding protein, partial [Desulfitobacterium sp.]|nr:peptide ABC transporter substrate-binding protein [Desulfitobacterium sp.]
MKKKLAGILSFVLVLSLLVTGCTSNGSKEDDDGTVTIGIMQIVEHPSLNMIREAIIEELDAQGYKDGENIKIEY